MNMDEEITRIVKETLKPVVFELVNESAKHAGHAGDDGSGQTHYKLMVVSGVFQNMNRVERHQYVLSLLKPCFEHGLHAISLDLQDEK